MRTFKPHLAEFRTAYADRNKNQLFEARVALMERGVYPMRAFIKSQQEVVDVAAKIQKLEEAIAPHTTDLPALHALVGQSSAVLFESKVVPHAVEGAMLNYAFVSEALRQTVKEAVALLAAKPTTDKTKSLAAQFGPASATKLLEFCFAKTRSHALLTDTAAPVIKFLGKELASNISVGSLQKLCEATPSFKLFVSDELHTVMAESLVVPVS